MSTYGIPLTGHFVNCRGSMINWCPIGRNASTQEREVFKRLDKENNIRKAVLEELVLMLEKYNLLNKIDINLAILLNNTQNRSIVQNSKTQHARSR